MLSPSAHIADFIKGFEQLRLKAFLPTPNDAPTIGWGATGADIHLGLEWTREQADARFAADLAAFGRGVAQAVGEATTSQGQFDALVSLTYNIGLKAMGSSSVLAHHRADEYAAAADAFALWNKQRTPMGLVVLDGLTRRRTAEAAIYRGGKL